jgi:putative ABC transport system permease protein
MEDLKAIAASVPSIDTWDPTQVYDDAPLRTTDGSTTGRVLGASERSEQVWQRSVSRGEFFDAAAVSRASRVALIGSTIERELFKNQDAVGAEISINGAPFRVIGVLESMGTDIHGLDRDNELLIPITTLMRRVLNVDTIRAAKILVKDSTHVTETALAVRRVLRERHGLAPDQVDDFTAVTPVQVQKLVSKTRQVLFLFLPLVAFVALLVGGVVSASLMLMSVSERIGEIGLRRALGATARDIAAQFLLETALISFVGGLLGAALGSLLSMFIAQKFAFPAFVSPEATVLGLALSVATGLASGVLPARRAARLVPIEALR